MKFEDELDLKRWLDRQSPAIPLALASRSALRVFPLLIAALGQKSQTVKPTKRLFHDLVITTLRANMLAWVGATNILQVAKYGDLSYSASLEITTALRRVRPVDPEAEFAAQAAGYAAQALLATLSQYYKKFLSQEIAAKEFDIAISASNAAKAAFDAPNIEGGASLWANLEADASVMFEKGRAGLIDAPLWTKAPLWINAPPKSFSDKWSLLRTELPREEGWGYWIDWYEAALRGKQPWAGLKHAAREKLIFGICQLPDEIWIGGAAAVNLEIERLIADAVPAPIAQQGPGPHFGLDFRDLVTPVAHLEYDEAANIPQTIRSLLPLTRRAAADLVAALPFNDPYRLHRDAKEYLAAVEPEPEGIDWGIVYGLGVFVENAAAAAEREISDALVPPMEVPAKKALDSLRALHLNLIIASGEGRKLMEEADALRLSRDEQKALRDDATKIAVSLKKATDVATPATAERLTRAAEAMMQGPHVERGSQFGLAAIGNVSVVLISVATLASFVPLGIAEGGTVGGVVGAAPAWLGYESLKKSKMFADATAALSGKYENLVGKSREVVLQQLVALAPFRDFVRANQSELRRIAEKSSRMRWALQYIDFIQNSDGQIAD